MTVTAVWQIFSFHITNFNLKCVGEDIFMVTIIIITNICQVHKTMIQNERTIVMEETMNCFWLGNGDTQASLWCMISFLLQLKQNAVRQYKIICRLFWISYTHNIHTQNCRHLKMWKNVKKHTYINMNTKRLKPFRVGLFRLHFQLVISIELSLNWTK